MWVQALISLNGRAARCRSMRRADAVWRRLRAPFLLPPGAAHTHRWELLDLDCAGCVVCGVVHRCEGDCRDVEVTDDAVVCVVTGVCVRTTVFAQTEYSDNVIVFTGAVNRTDALEARMAMVEAYVHEFLLSTAAESLMRHEFRKKRQRYLTHAAREMRAPGANAVRVLEAGVELYAHAPFDREARARLAAESTRVIQRVLGVAQLRFEFALKDSDVRAFVFGMLYLMCRGVVMHGVEILPQVKELRSMMPSENNVGLFFNFKSKSITETENKFKFVFRHSSAEQLRALAE